MIGIVAWVKHYYYLTEWGFYLIDSVPKNVIRILHGGKNNKLDPFSNERYLKKATFDSPNCNPLLLSCFAKPFRLNSSHICVEEHL